MDLKQMLRTFLIICVAKGYQTTLSLEFCSGKSIKDYFESSFNTFKLDGSNGAVQQWPSETGHLSCSCVVTPVSPVPDKLHVKFVHASKVTAAQYCNKNIEVRHANRELEHIFGCYSEKIEIQDDDLDEGIHFKLNWFGDSASTDVFYLDITAEPGSVLQVSCNSPILSTTSQANISSTTKTSPFSTTNQINVTGSSTIKTSTSTKAFVTAESQDSIMVVGVIVGLGLFFLLLITCLLCFIARRKIRSSQIQEKESSNNQMNTQNHNTIGRTLTHLYGKMKINRPLPSIPSSFRNIQPFKSRQQNLSGTYDSIKSNNSNSKQVLDKQQSDASDCSYLEPITITTISETVSNVNLKQKEMNSNQRTGDAIFVAMKQDLELQKSSTESANDLYLHPQFVAKGDSVQKSFKDDYINPSKETYVNLRDVRVPGKDKTELNNAETLKNESEIEINCSVYLRMDSKAAEDRTDQQNIAEENIDDTKSNKNILIETDSSGYTPMSSINKINKKAVLEQSDSTADIFPQLISFSPSYEAE